jgi:hypothetical protein
MQVIDHTVDTTQPVSQVYGNGQAINSATSQLGDLANNGLDTGSQNSIRKQFYDQAQADINAQKESYANRISAAKVQGQNQLGSNTALLASTGALGSNVGQASQFNTIANTNDTLASIEREKQNAIDGLLTKADAAAAKAIEDKTLAKQSGLSAYITHLNSQSDRQAKNAEIAGNEVLNSGYDISTIPADKLQALATGYGISTDAIKSAYNAAKAKHDAELAKQAQAGQFNLSPGEQRFDSQGNVIASVAPKASSVDQKIVQYQGQDFIQTTNPDGTISLSKQGLPQGVTTPRTAAAQDVLDTIDSLMSKNLKEFTGNIMGNLPAFGFSADGRKGVAEFEQLIALKSLENVSKLKGQGQVSDAERRLLANSVTSLRRDQSPEDFRKGLAQLKTATLLISAGEPGDIVTSVLEGGGAKAEKVQALQQSGYDPEKIVEYLYPFYKPPSQESFNQVGNTSVSIPGGTLAAKNNNPGNLRYAGQEGAQPGKGGFAMFSSPEAGAAALYHQVQLDASRGHNLSSFIAKFAPPTENDTALYVRQVAAMIGADPNTPLSQLDLHAVTRAIAKKESSTNIS